MQSFSAGGMQGQAILEQGRLRHLDPDLGGAVIKCIASTCVVLIHAPYIVCAQTKK
eukprot:m.228891 g.228891  ORF g.228891 m.228891 type:complete len:56 (-) comp15196_c2_seq2:218-385(-)